MSSNNPLDDLIGAARRRANKPGRAGPRAAGASKGALNPLDILTLPAVQRQVVNFLSRQKQARLEDVARGLPKIAAAEITKAIQTLKELGYIREALIEGEIYYRVAFGGTTSRAKVFLPEKIWSSLTVDNLTFLKQLPMFQHLPEAELSAFARELETRQYRRDEVIVWQDAPSDEAYLIKNGIVGIARLGPGRKQSQNLAYLKQGDILGEIGILEDQTRSATATALSKVEVLAIKRNQFLELVQKYDSAALELARMLGRQLVATSARLEQRETGVHLILVFRVGNAAGCTTVATALAATLAGETGRPTVYTEYAHNHHLSTHFNVAGDHPLYRHPAGYDIQLPQVDQTLPEMVDVALVVDRLTTRYNNIVMGLPDKVGESVHYLLERASQVIFVAPPDEKSWARLGRLKTGLKPYLRPERTGLLTIINRTSPAHRQMKAPGQADFDLPYLAGLPPVSVMGQPETPLPAALAGATKAIVDRLGRTHEIAVYIPTTIDVDQSLDTTAYVQSTLAFLGKRFGGATSSQAQGVWDSEEAGLVSETVHIVKAFVTQSEIDRYLNELLDYVTKMKTELKQEAMALEVDQKFMLV